MSERLLLREQLQCKSFEWYLTQIWPDNFFPNSQRFFGKVILVSDSSKIFKSYKRILRNIEVSKSSNWTYIIDYLNTRTDSFKGLLDETPVSCLKQPQQSRGSLSIPYGQAWIGKCNDKIFMDEMFVIRDDGHVSLALLFAPYFYSSLPSFQYCTKHVFVHFHNRSWPTRASAWMHWTQRPPKTHRLHAL